MYLVEIRFTRNKKWCAANNQNICVTFEHKNGFEIWLSSYWQNINFSQNGPKFHILKKIMILKVYWEIDRPTASTLLILWQGYV